MDEQKRAHILETAMKLFNKHGFHAMPTSRIAKESGVSVGTLFNYFPHKDDLIIAIYKDIKGKSKNSFLQHLDNNLAGYELLKLMWRSIIEWGVNNPDEFEYMSSFTHSPFLRQAHGSKMVDNYKKLRETILNMISPNTVCKEYQEYAMIYLTNSFRAATDFILDNNIQEGRERFINSSFDLFWKGFSHK